MNPHSMSLSSPSITTTAAATASIPCSRSSDRLLYFLESQMEEGYDNRNNHHNHYSSSRLFPRGGPKCNTCCNCCSSYCCCCCCYSLYSIYMMLLFLTIVVLAAFALYVIVGNIAFTEMFLVNEKTNYCLTRGKESVNLNTPSNWTAYVDCPALAAKLSRENHTFDPYMIPVNNWERVSFSSSQYDHSNDGTIIKLSALLLAQDHPEDNIPFVIIVHGYRGCNKGINELGAGGMLWHAGYNVLLLDLRNHGQSAVDTKNPWATFGNSEHLDVLGAVDYLVNRYPSLGSTHGAKIGVFGSSMGGATALIAYDVDKRLKACFVDSAAVDIYETLFVNLIDITYNNRFFASMVMSAARFVSRAKSSYGFPPFRFNPINSCASIANRPLFLHQSYGDLIAPEFNAIQCLMAARNKGGNPEVFWGDPGLYDHLKRWECDNHCKLILVDTPGFRDRLVTFFDKHLK